MDVGAASSPRAIRLLLIFMATAAVFDEAPLLLVLEIRPGLIHVHEKPRF